MAYKLEVREVDTTYHETGVGQADRVEKTYQAGAVIDNKWVAFASITADRLSSLPDDSPADDAGDKPAEA